MAKPRSIIDDKFSQLLDSLSLDTERLTLSNDHLYGIVSLSNRLGTDISVNLDKNLDRTRYPIGGYTLFNFLEDVTNAPNLIFAPEDSDVVITGPTTLANAIYSGGVIMLLRTDINNYLVLSSTNQVINTVASLPGTLNPNEYYFVTGP